MCGCTCAWPHEIHLCACMYKHVSVYMYITFDKHEWNILPAENARGFLSLIFSHST